MQKILIVEDEPDIVMGLRDNLEFDGYEVLAAKDGEEGYRRALQDQPDLILLDVMLPKMDGLDVCRRLRRDGITVPVIMLTARGQEIDKVLGLEIGADDYVTKPFSIKELLARIRAHLRRSSHRVVEIETSKIGRVEFNFKSYEAHRDGEALSFSPREFDIVRYFIEHEGEAVTRDDLLNAVWGYDAFPLTRTVDNHIAKIRQKIEDNPAQPRHIVTLHRVGYKFIG